MSTRVMVSGLSVADQLFEFARNEALPGSVVDETAFWTGAASLIRELSARIRGLVQQRAEMQSRIDDFHAELSHAEQDATNYEAFLRSIGYLVDDRGPATPNLSCTGVARPRSAAPR